MCHKVLGDARFHAVLLKFDQDLADAVRSARCGFPQGKDGAKCGGRLDSARYARKPRCASTRLPAEYFWRHSFCCDREGCRRRSTPPSARFLGRRVYLGAVVVLACAMQQGPTPTRAKRLRELFGVSLRTLARWREWWKAAFVESDFWKEKKAFFSPIADESGFPLSLLARFAGINEEERLVALLRFLGPISTPAGYVPDQRF